MLHEVFSQYAKKEGAAELKEACLQFSTLTLMFFIPGKDGERNPWAAHHCY